MPETAVIRFWELATKFCVENQGMTNPKITVMDKRRKSEEKEGVKDDG